MKILTISGSRGDRNAIEEVTGALESAGHAVSLEMLDGPELNDPADAAAFAGSVAMTIPAKDFDLAFLCGDRSEIAGAALGLYLMHIPIAHLSGGDVTLGSQDDALRNAITMLSQLHFPTNLHSELRLRRMLPARAHKHVHRVGSPAVDHLLKTEPISRETFFRENIKPFAGFDEGRAPYVLICLHPNTKDEVDELSPLIEALDHLPTHIMRVVIAPNTDPGNVVIRDRLQAMVAAGGLSFKWFEDLPAPTFYSLLKGAEALIGNSSAGCYEAPYFKTPVVNIGRRQAGRQFGPLSWDVTIPNAELILASIGHALENAHRKDVPPFKFYGDGTACDQIVKVLASIDNPKDLLK